MQDNFKIDHSSPIPLHRQVESLLREMIHAPEYQNGKLLPKEVDMAKRLGISRNTLRQATNKLVHENLLIRKKGVGTKVAKKTVSTRLNNWFSFSQEMQEKGVSFINYDQQVQQVSANKEVAQQLEIAVGREVVCLERIRGGEEGPFLYSISYFHPRIGLTGEEDYSRHLYEILQHDFSTIPSISKEEIRAVLADPKLGLKLGMEVGEPVLFRQRLVCDPGNRPIEFNRVFYRGDQFVYEIDIKR